MSTRRERLFLLLALAFLVCALSCDQFTARHVGELLTESRSIALGDAKSVQVEISMGVGELKLAGGAAELLDAEFAYNIAEWKPEVQYDVSGNEGRLTIRQPHGTRGGGTGVRYEWDLRLNNNVPMNLKVELGAGKTQLTLGGLALKQLELHMGVGETLVDLTGDWKSDLEATIRGGVGKATVRLPEDVGVRVNAQGGIGKVSAPGFRKDGSTYVNDAYGKSEVTLRVDVQGGIGEINLELGGAPPVI